MPYRTRPRELLQRPSREKDQRPQTTALGFTDHRREFQTSSAYKPRRDSAQTELRRLNSDKPRRDSQITDILGVRQGSGGRPLLFAPLMNGKRIWMFRGERRRMGQLAWCDMSSNAFLARRDTIAKLRWDPEIKTYEHWEFFYRASHLEGLKIAVAEDCMVVHAHVGAKPYGDLRCRPKFRKLGLRKHGFHSMRYPGGGIVHA